MVRSKISMRLAQIALMVLALVSPAPVSAQDVGDAQSTYSGGVLVTSKDVTNCPYHQIATISVNMRLDFGGGSRANMFQRLRSKAQKIGADAVVLVTVGDAHMTLMSFSQRNVAGRAIQYVNKSCAPTQ